MAQVKSGGPLRGHYPDDYEGQIPTNFAGDLYQKQETDGEGKITIIPTRIVIRLRQIAPRYIYKRTKRLVASI